MHKRCTRLAPVMSNYFKTRRDELGLTQRAVAESLGISTQAVSAWEDGTAYPRPKLWDGLASAFKVKPERIAKEVLKAARRESEALSA
jgi:transcriptional regulator with XRE-family HTH domain